MLIFVAILDDEGLEPGIAGLPSGQATSVLPSKPAKSSPVCLLGLRADLKRLLRVAKA